jgi:hypothetical protein
MTERDQELTRAMAAPATFSEATRSVDVVIASGNDPGDGIRLAMRREAITTPAVVPVLLDHASSIDRMGGRIDPASLRIERGLLVGTAHLSDAPAADAALALARSGVAASVKASFTQSDLSPLGDGSMLANRWTLRSVALVPEPADSLAVTRAAHPTPSPSLPSETTMETDQTAQAPAEETISRAELRRQNSILRACAAAKLPEDFTQELIDSGKSMEEAAFQIVRHQRMAQERTSVAGHPAQIPVMGASATAPADGLEQVIERAVRGQALQEPLAYTLRRLGFSGGTDAEVVRSALSGRERFLSRSGGGMHSTSDFPSLLLSSGTRFLQEQYSAAPRGIRQLARPRNLNDFRPVSVLDVGLVGKAQKILEGGEIKFGSATETAGTYAASRYGMGLSFSFEALKNDDLGGLGQVLEEFAGVHLSDEADALAALLSGSGANAPDGQALFHVSHNNSTTAALTVDGLRDAIKLLRNQKSVGGRFVNLEPASILVGPELETQGAQLLSDLWRATAPEDSNPWRSLQLLVEPSLAGATWYLIAGGNRRPFELGQVVGLPRMQQEEDFSTSAYRMKTEAAFGCAVADHRVIVRAVAPA